MFEVRKQYKFSYSFGIYTCMYVSEYHVVLRFQTPTGETAERSFHPSAFKDFTEYVPPKPVCKFKVGDFVSSVEWGYTREKIEELCLAGDGKTWVCILANRGGWHDTEYLEACKPLTFTDLKVGEKFKWCKTEDHHVPVYTMIKVRVDDQRYGYYFKKNHTVWSACQYKNDLVERVD